MAGYVHEFWFSSSFCCGSSPSTPVLRNSVASMNKKPKNHWSQQPLPLQLRTSRVIRKLVIRPRHLPAAVAQFLDVSCVIHAHFMKPRTQLLLAASVILPLLVGCKPTGPVTEREFRSLTNAVQRVTSDPIYRIDRGDGENLMTVFTRSLTVTNEQRYYFERTRFGWKYIPIQLR